MKEGGEHYDIAQIYPHEKFNVPSYANDIALIRVNRDILFSKNVQPIALYPRKVPENSSLQLSESIISTERRRTTNLNIMIEFLK